MLDKAIALRPDDPTYLYHKVALEVITGRTSDALHEAIQLDSQNKNSKSSDDTAKYAYPHFLTP